MKEEAKRKELLILEFLKGLNRPVSSRKISESLLHAGYRMSERTVRFYLKKMEEEGLAKLEKKRGYTITEKGMEEIESSRVIEKVGFLSSKIDQMAYAMDFDINTLKGKVVVNLTIVEPERFEKKIPLIEKVFEKGYTMGELVTFLPPGERLNHIFVPEGKIGVATVCSITLNGVLLKHGIPTVSRFGGLLELRNGRPYRFVEIIMYDGTSVDPLEIFVKSGMTDYLGAIRYGNGKIGASFREFPVGSREEVLRISEKMRKIGLGGLLEMGLPGHSLLEIPVYEGRVGAIVVGGLNAVSILEETGIKTKSRALAGLIEYSRLFRYEKMREMIKDFRKWRPRKRKLES
ncbi:MAG: NrpR regulatory domain-containing protein [Desulfobacterota bacterium]|nr:NrpR regulatory domain-containing protein [Thermodesulfobacteriota bacterium]MDW8001177.1 NrpR regulatory domain-containing protein [Deltaproteobacteria bacterium]